MFRGKKQKRIISVILTVTLLSAAAATVTGVGALTVKSLNDAVTREHQANEADRNMAQNISDVTGVSTATLLKMKTDNNSWNDVLQEIQDRGVANTQDMTDEELAAFTATQDAEDVKTVTALAQRVIFNLREITAKQSAQEIQKQAVVAEPGKTEPEDEHDFETLATRFQKNRSVYLTLALCKQFGSFEQTMDEYLYSLQIEVDFTLCLQDADEYEKQVAKKGAELLRSDAITVSLIEQTMLELLNTKEEESQEKGKEPAEAQKPNVEPNGDDIVPKADKPDYEVEKPSVPMVNPQPEIPSAGVDIYNEIDQINKSVMPY